VDDHPIFRDGLAGLLATLPDVEIAGTAGTAEQALAAVATDAPDIVLMDIHLPGTNGVEATRAITATAPAVAVLAVTMVGDDDMVLAAMAAGARGYVLKDATAEEIIAAVHTVAAGGAVLGARIAARLLNQARTADGPARSRPTLPRGEQLTTREREV